MDQEGTNNEVQPKVEAVEEIAAETEEKQVVDSTPLSEPTTSDKANEPVKKKLSKKQKIALIASIILLLVIIGVGVWYFFLRPSDEPQNDQTDTSYTPSTIEKLALKGNGLSDFDFEFLKLNNDSDNIIYSPLSIKYALGMLADAADGDSKTQITNLLGDYQPKAYLNSTNRSLANAMFIRTDSEFSDLIKDSYIDTVKAKYGASVIYDSFESPNSANKWVSDETLGIIDNIFNEDNFNTLRDFALVNALSIDMWWNNQLQCTLEHYKWDRSSYSDDELSCERYRAKYAHENYNEYIDMIWEDTDFSTMTFNTQQDVTAAEIGASANRYDIIKELGEDYIRETVQKEYEKFVQENGESDDDKFSLDEYMEALKKNYGRLDESTDFAFYDSEAERVFAKDLRQYDGATLQYIGFMPKTEELNSYIDNLTAEKVNSLIDNLKNVDDIYSFKDGVVTKIHAYIPFFHYDYNMEKLKNNLEELGIVNVFDVDSADLSNIVDLEGLTDNAYIMDAVHKADIDFSNDGIKAAAATAVMGGEGGTGSFDYLWEVPVEEIDLTFDKPFVFIIRDKSSGEAWFTGAVYNI